MKKENSMKWLFAIALLTVLIASLSVAGYYLQEKPKSNEGKATLIIKSLGSTKTERFEFKGTTALAILKHRHAVETQLKGNFIKCIDDVCADGNYWWLFYVNNKTAKYGAKRYRPNDEDIIMFEFSNKNI